MKRGIWISLFVLFVYILSYAGVQHSIDELATISLSDSFLHQSMNVNRMEWEQERYPPQNAYGVDGDLYSKKGLAAVMATMPLLLAGKHWTAVGAVQLAFLTSALVTAVTIFVFYLLALSLGYTEGVATLSALSLGLGTLLWPYAQMLFSEPIAALGITLSLWSLAVFWKKPAMRWLILCGTGGAFLILSRTANALLVLPFSIASAYRIFTEWYRQKNWQLLLKSLIAYGMPLVIIVIALISYNHTRFGTLLSYPTVAGEAFTTPLWLGLSGQLWSSGKGLIFYVPLTLMVILSVLVDFPKMRSPIYLTAFVVILVPILLYSTWYDWPGGKAWGPRFLVPIMPILVLLCLPAINWLNQPRPWWRRSLLAGWLFLSFLVQLPGVLVNFDYQEILDGKAGTTYQDLLWNWHYSPLITYWDDIFTGAANPVWLHSFFWDNDTWLLAFIGFLVFAIVGIHILLIFFHQHQHQRKTNLFLGVLAVLTIFLGLSVVAASREDLRWQERTETIEANRAVRAYIQEAASTSDLVLLELRETYDGTGRVWEWLNEAPLLPDYIAYKRKPEISPTEADRLQRWLLPYDRVWLVLQATPYGDPGATTENWLRTWAYEGQNQWLESQRVVEYLIPANQATGIERTAVFQTNPPLLLHYQFVEGQTPDHILLDLRWEGDVSGLKYSVQALSADQAQIVQQVDKQVPHNGSDKVGLFVLNRDAPLVLKVYDPAAQTIYPLTTAVHGEIDYLSLIPTGNQ